MEKKQNRNVRSAAIQGKKNRKAEIPKVVNIIKEDKEFTEPPKGNATSICKTCGKRFDQDFYAEQNRYSNYKNCHTCRKKISLKKEKKIQEAKKETETATAILPFEPHPWQAQAFKDFQTHRFNLWACGNRSGYNALFVK